MGSPLNRSVCADSHVASVQEDHVGTVVEDFEPAQKSYASLIEARDCASGDGDGVRKSHVKVPEPDI